eukprot:534187-Lingulodinium_polyedra.AAC.1
MLRLSVPRGPNPVSVLAEAVRPQTRAQATLIAQMGRFQPRSTLCSQACPMRSKAFSWPARVTAGHPSNSGVAA